MTQFDESQHNRASDGKFTAKPHAEANGVTLGASRPHTGSSPGPQPVPASTLRVGDVVDLGPVRKLWGMDKGGEEDHETIQTVIAAGGKVAVTTTSGVTFFDEDMQVPLVPPAPTNN